MSATQQKQQTSQEQFKWEVLPQNIFLQLYKGLQKVPTQNFHQRIQRTFRHVQQPKINTKHNGQMQLLSKRDSHLWIFIHNISPPQLIKSQQYKKLQKMYQWSRYLQKRCCYSAENIHKIEEEIFKWEIPVKIFVTLDIITEDTFFKKLKSIIKNQYLNQIIVKAVKNDEQQKSVCYTRFIGEFKNQQKIQNKFNGVVADFSQAMQLDAKILNLLVKNLKPNFLILNKLDDSSTSDDPDSFHDILINSKAYLQESLSIRTNDEANKALQTFKLYIQKEVEDHYKLLQKKDFTKQIRQETQRKRSKQEDLLKQYFQKFNETFTNDYPFPEEHSDNSPEEQFYRDIIHLYTKQTQVYRSVNMLLKTTTNRDTFMKISFFCKFLNEAIKYFYRKNIGLKRYDAFKIPLYRGTYISNSQWEQIKKSTGQYVLNLGFTSTSKNKRVAQSFTGKLKNNIILEIKFHQNFYQTSKIQRYFPYFQLLIDINSDVMGNQNQSQDQILFNCFNIFKIKSVRQDKDKGKVLQLQYGSHIDIIQKKKKGQDLTPIQEKILNTIVRIEKVRDYADNLIQEGRTEEVGDYYEKMISGGVQLKNSQAENYIKICCQSGKMEDAEQYIKNVTERTQKKIQNQIHLALFHSMREEHLEAEEKLLKSMKQLQQTQKQLRITHIQQVRQTWEQLMTKQQNKFYLVKTKHKLGQYEQCITLLLEILMNLDNKIRATQFRQNIQALNSCYDYFQRQKQQKPKLKPQFFKQLYGKIKQKNYNENIDSQIASELGLQFYQALMHQIRILLLNDEQQQKQKKQSKNMSQKGELSRQNQQDLLKFKECFFKRCNMKVNILIYYYQILIKSERLIDIKMNEDDIIANHKFIIFFKQKDFFKMLFSIYKKQINMKHQMALFFNQYSVFITAYCNIYSNIDENQQKLQEQKKELKQLRNQIIKMSISIFSSRNKNHQELANINLTRQRILGETLYNQRQTKIKTIASLIGKVLPKNNQVDSNALIKEKFQMAKEIINISLQSANIHKNNRSIMNMNNSYSSQLSANLEILNMPENIIKNKQIWLIQAHRIDAKIEANVSEVQFLKGHSSNAFNYYLRGMLFFYKGHFEGSMVYLGKSEQILNQIKNKNLNNKKLQQMNAKQRQTYEQKINNFVENNQIKIKLIKLKSQLCIYYSPKIYRDCLRDLTSQVQFIKKQMFQLNSQLPQLYECIGLIQYITRNQKPQKIIKQYLINARQILIKSFRVNQHGQILKILNLLFMVEPKQQKKLQYYRQFQEKSIAYKMSVDVQKGTDYKESLIQYNYLYILNKIHVLSTQNKTQNIAKIQNYWKIFDQIILFKIKKRLPISLKEIGMYFQYCDFLFSQNLIKEGLGKIIFLIEKLQIYQKFLQDDKVKFNLSDQIFNQNQLLNKYFRVIETGIIFSKQFPEIVKENKDLYPLNTLQKFQKQFLEKFKMYQQIKKEQDKKYKKQHKK